MSRERDELLVPLERLAELVGKPASDLVRLDHNDRSFAFLPDTIQVHTLRVRSTGERLRIATTLEGARVDATDLKERSQALVEEHAPKMGPTLRRLLERHPTLPAMEVQVARRASDPDAPPEAIEPEALPARDVARLVTDPDVLFVDLVGDPEVLDDAEN
jgi:hypothetical protein